MLITKRLLVLSLAATLLKSTAVFAGVGEATIDAYGNVVATGDDDGGVDVDVDVDPSIPPTEELSITITNKSPYRVDVYYDDGDYGMFMGILDTDDSTSLKSFIGHSFFVTRHGVKEGLFQDPGTDHEKRVTYKVGRRDQIFLVPENSAPSTNPCQDRFSICKTQAETGGCSRSPGWMIVHCCESCDPHLNSRELIDPKKRCSKEQLKTPWVVVFDNFLTDDEVRDLIRGGEIEGFERSTDQGATNDLGEMEKVVSKTRTSANAWYDFVCLSIVVCVGFFLCRYI